MVVYGAADLDEVTLDARSPAEGGAWSWAHSWSSGPTHPREERVGDRRRQVHAGPAKWAVAVREELNWRQDCGDA